MTIASIKQMVAAHGADNVIAILFDNDYIHYFNEDAEIVDFSSDDVFEVIDGEEYIKLPGKARNTKTGKYDIPVTNYKGVENIQGILFIDNDADKEYLDWGNMYLG